MYLSWEDIKDDLSREELKEIIDEVRLGSDVNEVITDYIEANYEPLNARDTDHDYEVFKDSQMFA
jgi:uncharacterized protein YeeX (DUF496 family)